MKKITLIGAIIIGIMFSPTKQVKAQNNQGEFVASAGVGYSLIFSLLNYGLNNGANVSTSITPAISVAGDYSINGRFSLGLGIGYQSMKTGVTNYNDSANGYYNQSFNISLSRLNIGIRPLFHFGSNPNVDFYLGFRVGVSIWSFSSTSTDPNYNAPGLRGTLPSFQALMGFKGYFSPVVGAHIEVAVGTPYFLEAGLSFRFGGTVGK
ncbi:MAG TPA: hypothetical protein VK806_01640 [Bacteroidia bacterium]|jgi:hypothetical protein|nr:hypothetical protein [Bacteroidia bacterium]